ncbi:59_t:CDS:10 [Dentiscutata erythropus]|uniref:59_t:CDS:1 n=1 Tax=Dentiscutata erythropus TaxID=1348616 RepID=A0A9N8ZAG4_9GLOM|nr:59_t:CDS:10 [Dentiscutata erythropus]
MPSDSNKSLFYSRYQPYDRRKRTERGMNVTLTTEESELCNFLTLLTQYMKENCPELPLVELRIAGGWVRDKLLGYECNDLDIAINSMTGCEFGEHVYNFLRLKGYAAENIHKIESNPQKSKHLETATTKIFGREVDFVNLRSEEYVEDSRIPSKVTFGTPEQDAYRRDLTINALFYNIHTRQVEDPTKKGITDLKEGLIRTPLEPYETFKDDPLRVLRCIRFASRFDFSIDETILIAVKDEQIKKAISAKVSRERIGIEVDKMIKGPHPALSIKLIHELGIYYVIFAPPQDYHGTLDDPKTAACLAKILEWLLLTSNENHLHVNLSSRTPEDIRTLYLASFLAPHKNIEILSKKKNYTSFHHVVKESLKLKSLDGLLIRDIGTQWQNAFILALICELLPKYPDVESGILKEPYNIIDKYNELVDFIIELNLQNCFNDKPIINGVIIGEIQKSVIEWQLENPGGSKRQCEDSNVDKYKNEILTWYTGLNPDSLSGNSRKPEIPPGCRHEDKIQCEIYQTILNQCNGKRQLDQDDFMKIT